MGVFQCFRTLTGVAPWTQAAASDYLETRSRAQRPHDSTILMSEPAGNLVWLSHPRLTASAMSALPAWLWSIDATRLLWANPAGAAIFDAPTSTAIRASTFGSRGPAAIQLARLAATLPPDGAMRFERLRGLGAGIGGVLTCACSCITLSDQTRAILVAATERAGDDFPLSERVRRLLAECAEPIAAFSPEGNLIYASAAARQCLGGATSLAALGAEVPGANALAADAAGGGPATTPSRAGPLTIERVEAEAATILLAVFGTPRQAGPAAAEATALAWGGPGPAPPTRRGGGQRAQPAAAFRLAGGCRASLHGRFRGIRRPDG